MRAGILRGLALALLLAGVIGLGYWARERLRGHERYLFRFAEIDCPTPDRMDHGAFLDEVQYAAQMPDTLDLLDEGLSGRLAAAFHKHPWVEEVLGVEIKPGAIRVQLRFRRPVLAVRVGKDLRAVDRHGVLLPKSASTDSLPQFPGHAHSPVGPVGKPWGDPAVEAMARSIGRKSS
jgi:hypothetical protein